MRQLLLFRHAKSSWAADGQDDFDRPLNARGRKAVPVMGAYLGRNGIAPDLILCSSACRTRETLALVLPFLQGEATVRFEDPLYLASGTKLLNRLKQVDNRFERVMILGHNPGLQDLALMLAGDGEGEDLAQLAAKFPTAALAQLDFDAASWVSLDRHSGKLARFVTPKRLAD